MSFTVKNTTIPGLLDLIAPHSCRGCGHIGSVLCDCCKKNLIKQHQQCHPLVYAIAKRAGLIKNLIYDYKFNSTRAAASPLAEVLYHCLPTTSGPVYIVPLPTISKHIRKRGFDHTFLLAKKLARLNPDWQVQKLLVRASNSVQVGSSAKLRKVQAEKAYALNPKYLIDKNATYLLLDDIWTTGSSMLSAYKILKKAGLKKIKMSVLAISQMD